MTVLDRAIGYLAPQVALRRARQRAAIEEPIGPLLANRGGPGADGATFGLHASSWFGDDITDNFDVVGWERLVLSGLSIDFAGATLSGDLTVPLDGGPLTGVLSGQTDTLGHVAKIAGLDADGKANYALRLAPNAAKQGAAIRFEGRDVAVGRAATIASVVATASSDDTASRSMSSARSAARRCAVLSPSSPISAAAL